MKQYLFALALLPAVTGTAQNATPAPADAWNHKQCAVVLTYDDAIDQDLDNVVPALDSLGLKGTLSDRPVPGGCETNGRMAGGCP
jgi:hypothetical protein